MKRILTILLAVLMVFALVGCGSSTPSEKKEENTNNETINTNVFSSISTKNYKEMIKEAFGITLDVKEDWEVQEASSPNGVNNMIVSFIVPEDTDGKVEIESYFDQCLDLSGVFGQLIDWDTLAISKGENYTDFESFFTKEGTDFLGLYSAMWLYDYKDKCVQFSYIQDETEVEFSFTYTVLDYEIDVNQFIPQEGEGPEGWIWQSCHGFIDDVWDSTVLPSNFPKEIKGVKVKETRLYEKGCEDRWSGSRVGNIYFDDWNFKDWKLTFDATEAQVLEFEKALEANGFIGYKVNDEYEGIYAELSDGELYVYYSLDESYEEGFDYNVYCAMTILEYERPLYFEALELPKDGLFTRNIDECFYYAYDEEYNEVENYEYDFSKGKAISEATYIYYDFEYMGVERKIYDDYIAYLRSFNFDEWNEYVYNEEDQSYVVSFKYNDTTWIGCYFNFDGGINEMRFIISPDSESLFW